MIKRVLAIALVSFGLTQAAYGQTSAIEDLTIADARCLVVGFSLAGAGPTPEARQAGNLISIYYVGRIHGRTPDANMEELVYQQASQATAASLEADRVRCGEEVQQVGRDLITMGTSLQSRGLK